MAGAGPSFKAEHPGQGSQVPRNKGTHPRVRGQKVPGERLLFKTDGQGLL